MKFTVVGQILDSSGYSNHCRQLFNALAKENDVKLVTGLTQDWVRLVNDKELEAIKKDDDVDRIKIIVTHPIYWRINATNKINYAYCVWEGKYVPKSFIEEMLNPNINKIIVPSNHSCSAIVNTAHEIVGLYGEKLLELTKKIVTIHHGVNHEIFKPENKKSDKFTFLINKGFRNMLDRGGAQYSLKAYIEEFTNKDNVRLIFKINPAYGVPDIMKIIKELGGNREDLPEIVIDANNYSYEQLNNLYNECDVLLATTRAEGFNLPCIEAMACGKSVITTNFGGQIDFINEENGFLINYDLEEVKHEIQYEGNFWATPKLDEIRRAMRECYLRPDYVTEKGKKALETSLNYSWEKTVNQFLFR